jgi:hypothetical protein
MNLRSWNNKIAGTIKRPVAVAASIRQLRRGSLLSATLMTRLCVRLRAFAVCAALAAAIPFTVSAQTNYYTTNGTEYAVIGALPGDQMFPDVALSTNGGYVVWQDNATDGDGWGISARRLDSTLSGSLSSFRVNVTGSNDQENARVTLLKNGGAVFVWQGGKESYQHIFARYLTPTNTWLTTTDLVVSAFTNNFQINPAIATLNNSNIVVVWSSFNQASTNSLLDVYAKILSPSGATVKAEFLVNQFTNWNQRTPAVAALNNGGFVVAWVSEQQRATAPNLGTNSTYYMAGSIVVPSVDIYARLFQSDGTVSGNEFIVNTDGNPCANPAVAAASDGTFMVAWSGRDMAVYTNGWNVYARPFSGNGIGGNLLTVNTHLSGNQFAPRLNAIGLDYMFVWTSLDITGKGIYGRFVHSDGTPTSGEFQVNTTAISQQLQPVVASDGVNQFLAIWTSYTASPSSYDLFAQRYINVNVLMLAMPAPFVYAPFVVSNNAYQPQLQVSWAPLTGISVSNYQVYVDGAGPLAVTKTNFWLMTAVNGLTTNSTHSFQLTYVKPDGHESPRSAPTSATTWSGVKWGGIPYEWMVTYYGSDMSTWPAASAPVGAAGNPTLQTIFLSGGNPQDSSTWLTTRLVSTQQGMFLNWNTQPGFTYQVQVSTAFTNWSNFGLPRFAAGATDSVLVGGSAVGYYRVVLVR